MFISPLSSAAPSLNLQAGNMLLQEMSKNNATFFSFELSFLQSLFEYRIYIKASSGICVFIWIELEICWSKIIFYTLIVKSWLFFVLTIFLFKEKLSQVYFTVWLTVQRGILVHNASNKHIRVVQNAQTICLNVNKNIFRNIAGSMFVVCEEIYLSICCSILVSDVLKGPLLPWQL